MSIKMLTYLSGRHLATASALSLLLAAPALAQNAPSEGGPGGQQTDASAATQGGTSNREHARNIEGAYESIDFSTSGNSNENQPPQDQEIIERSFSDDVDTEAVSKVEAGTTQEPQGATGSEPSTSAGLTRNADTDARSQQDEELRNVPEGSGVIAVDGKVIARTEGESDADATAESSAATEQQQPNASEAGGGERTAASETQGESREQSPPVAARESGNLQNVFEQLQDATVINSSGEELGTVTGVVLDNDSGDSGLVVQTAETAQSVGYLLAPVADVTINDAEITWQTEATAEELRQSATYNPQVRDEVSARQSDDTEEGMSRR